MEAFLRGRLEDVLAIEQRQIWGHAVAFGGRLRLPPGSAVDVLRGRLGPLGYAPFIREERGLTWVQVVPQAEVSAAGRPLVVVYGGALHNDLFPDPALAKYTFGRKVHAATRGAYREIDLYVPEMVDTTPALRDEPWFKAWQRAGAGCDDVVIERNPRSTIVIFRRGGAEPGR